MTDALGPLRVKLATGHIPVCETYRGLALRVVTILYGEDYVEILALNPDHGTPERTFSCLWSGAIPRYLVSSEPAGLRRYARDFTDRWWRRTLGDRVYHADLVRFASADGIPWEIHAIHDADVREAAVSAYLVEASR